MAIVKFHKAADGSLHETFQSFAKKEAELKMRPQLAELAGAIPHSDDAGTEVLYASDFADFVIANADKLREILNGGVISKRGRTPGKKEAPVAAAA